MTNAVYNFFFKFEGEIYYHFEIANVLKYYLKFEYKSGEFNYETFKGMKAFVVIVW